MNALRGIAGRSLSYNIEDQLLTVGSAVYQYNLDGFLRVKVDGADSTVYDYSSRGELLSVNLPNGDVIEYVHDPLGRRIAKKVNGVTIEKYLWSGLTRLLAVYDGANNLLMRFEYADGRMPVAMMVGATRYYLAYDQVGSLRAVTDSAGTLIKRIDYDTFGNILADSNPGLKVPFGFAGGLYDGDTELVRFGARDYDPQIGRWTAKDPIGFSGGDEDLYGYTLDDPVNGVDPEGLYWEWAWNGTIVHSEFTAWGKRTFPAYNWNEGLLSGLRPDVVDHSGKKIWDLKPRSHRVPTKQDRKQMEAYMCATGYELGDPSDILPSEGYYLGSIKDVFGGIQDIYLYSGEPGFILYELRKRTNYNDIDGNANMNFGPVSVPNMPSIMPYTQPIMW